MSDPDNFKTQTSQISYHNRRGMMDPNSEDFGAEWIVLGLAFLIIMGALATIGTFLYMLWSIFT